jgi:hypothetical protein
MGGQITSEVLVDSLSAADITRASTPGAFYAHKHPPRPLRLAEKRPNRLAAELEAAGAPVSTTTAGPLVYPPSWKIDGRPHLSREGKDKILSAFDQGMRPTLPGFFESQNGRP